MIPDAPERPFSSRRSGALYPAPVFIEVCNIGKIAIFVTALQLNSDMQFYKTSASNLLLLISASLFTLHLSAQSLPEHWMENTNKRLEAALLNNELDLAKTMWNAAVDSASALAGAESPAVADLMETGSTIARFDGDYETYEKRALRALNIRKKHFGPQHVSVASALVLLSEAKRFLGQIELVEGLLNEAVQMLDALGAGTSDEMARALSGLGTYYESEGYMFKAGEYHKRALDIEFQLHGDVRYEYGVYANNLAVLYHILSSFDQAIYYYDLSLKNTEKFTGKEHPDYIITQKNKGAALNNVGRFKEAEHELLEALSIARKIYPPGDAEISYYLRALAIYYQIIGRYDLSAQVKLEALELLKNKLGDKHPQYLGTLFALVYDYDNQGKQQEAISTLKTIISSLEESKRTKTLIYAQARAYLGQYYIDAGNISEARRIIEPAIQLADSISGKGRGTPDYYEKVAGFWINLLTAEGKSDEALKELDYWRGILSKNYDPQQDLMIDLESLSGSAYLAQGDWKRALEHYKVAWRNIQLSFNNRFAYLSMENREKFADSYKVYQEVTQTLSRAAPNDPEIQGFMFDILLFQKELLSWYDRTMLQQWREESNADYVRYREIRQMIARQMTLPVDSRKEMDALEQRKTELERKLAERTPLLELRAPQWQSVQQKLQSGEAAVEFFSAKPQGYGGKAAYAALVLTPGMQAPRFVLLGDIEATDALFASKGARGLQYATRVYNNDALYRQLWRPIEPLLSGVKRIYYTPTGTLHLLNMDALPVAAGGGLLSDRFELVRLGNSGNLLQAGFRDKLFKPETALIAGGLDYEDAHAEEMPLSYPASASRGYAPRGGNEQEWPSLPNTLIEVEKTAAMLSGNNIAVSLLTGKTGSEQAVKARCMGNNPPDILHIATHGFFFEKNTGDVKGGSGLAGSENPMYRSGLILSGANPAWKGQKIPDNAEDGILTAEEIALFHLKNTKLVVLSACETGLGDTRDDEGVYGLQRAFRLAGARSIVMTLWRVPDEPTRIFMEYFYRALLETKDTHQAFTKARSEMRKTYPHPYYWAGFILSE